MLGGDLKLCFALFSCKGLCCCILGSDDVHLGKLDCTIFETIYRASVSGVSFITQ